MNPCFCRGGGVVAAAAPLVVVEAVTARVSVLPVVGSDILTGLSVAAGGADQLLLGSGDILDKVGHGAGQSGVRIVPVEHPRSWTPEMACGRGVDMISGNYVREQFRDRFNTP